MRDLALFSFCCLGKAGCVWKPECSADGAVTQERDTLSHIPHWDDECNQHAKNNASNGAQDREVSWNAEREKERVGTATQADPPPTPLLHRYRIPSGFWPRTQWGSGLWPPLPRARMSGWLTSFNTMSTVSPNCVFRAQRDKLARRKTIEAQLRSGGRPSGLRREWDLTWGPLYLLTSAAFACHHGWFCW